ncbi:MAG: hypothetical protein VR69_09315 [Peptococcaceae bacterium BRH_c4b]|nr:MAG: hypothetical protein VR69_09315 [Peptococcaceae bacterium BRH_c4b]
MAALIEMRNFRGEASGLVPEEVHFGKFRPLSLYLRLNLHYNINNNEACRVKIFSHAGNNFRVGFSLTFSIPFVKIVFADGTIV